MEKIIIPSLPGAQTQIEIVKGNAFNVLRTQNVDEILKRNLIDRNDGVFDGPGKDMRHVARIPVVMLELWAQEAGIPRNECMGPKMTEIIRRKLNDPDNEFLRTGKGKI